MASVDAQALQQDRQGDRGSDETALQERRRIQKLVRTGDEQRQWTLTLCKPFKQFLVLTVSIGLKLPDSINQLLHRLTPYR